MRINLKEKSMKMLENKTFNFRLGKSKKGMFIIVDGYIIEYARICLSCGMLNEDDIKFEFNNLREQLDKLKKQALRCRK